MRVLRNYARDLMLIINLSIIFNIQMADYLTNQLFIIIKITLNNQNDLIPHFSLDVELLGYLFIHTEINTFF